jgi:LmbE family N-acetylglucosaminyl deacetylase
VGLTPAGAWLRAAELELPLARNLDVLLGRDAAALVLAPHPDDESLGCGGLLAACAEVGRPATVVVVSDGTGSHPNSRAWPASRLAALRQAETSAAVAALGLDPAQALHFLGLPDRAVPSADAAAVAAILAVAPAAPLTVFAPWRHDPHGDHTACFALAEAAVRALPPGTRLFAYPVWGWAFAYPIAGFPLPEEPRLAGPPRGLGLDITRHLPAKRRAVAAHASQLGGVIEDDPAGFRLPPEALALAFRPVEWFLAATPA